MTEATTCAIAAPIDILNARLPGYQGLQQILIDTQGVIKSILSMDVVFKKVPPADLQVLDVAGDWVSLGGVDLQINGALGLAFPDLNPENCERLPEICQFLWNQGVDGFLPTIVTTSVQNIQRSLAVLADFVAPPQPPLSKGGKGKPEPPVSPLWQGGVRGGEVQGTSEPLVTPPWEGGVRGGEVQGTSEPLVSPPWEGRIRGGEVQGTSEPLVSPLWQGGVRGGAQILGVHLEGPFLNPQKRGAHPAEHLLPLTIDNVKRVLGDYAKIVKVITLAPELDETGEVIPYLRSLGITVSLGHSQATAAQAEQAFQLGAAMVTHAFNAMPSLHHREPGLLGAAILHPDVRCGLIADGQHVSPTMMQIILRASGYEQGIFLVSDALAPLGLPDGVYPWDTRQIEVKNGTARLLDGTLSGTTLPILAGVQNLVKWGICELESAIAIATEAPRRAIGLPGLAAGQPAHLLRWRLNESTGELTWKRLLPS